MLQTFWKKYLEQEGLNVYSCRKMLTAKGGRLGLSTLLQEEQ